MMLRAAAGAARRLSTAGDALMAEHVRKMFPTATKELADCSVAAFVPVQVFFFLVFVFAVNLNSASTED